MIHIHLHSTDHKTGQYVNTTKKSSFTLSSVTNGTEPMSATTSVLGIAKDGDVTVSNYTNSTTMPGMLTTKNKTPTTEEPASTGILVMVMGEAKNYPKWNQLWSNYLVQQHVSSNSTSSLMLQSSSGVKNEKHIHHVSNNNATAQMLTHGIHSFIYASFDEPVVGSSITTTKMPNSIDMITSKTIFIPGTTWTEGRNKLAEEALRNEKKLGQTYKYWVFLDEDIDFECGVESTAAKDAQLNTMTENESFNNHDNEQRCWNRFLDFLNKDELVPPKVTTVTVKRGKPAMDLEAVSKPDAIIAAFKRQSVPYLFPYATLEVGESQFTSQKILFCVMKTCLKQSAMYIPFMNVKNHEHRKYARGFNITSYLNNLFDNYNQYLDLKHCQGPEYHESHRDDVLTASSPEELNKLIPRKNISCQVLQSRFYDWQLRVEREM